MKKPLLLATALIVIATMRTTAQEVSVQPLVVQVGSPLLESMDFSLRPGNAQAGTSVHLLISGLPQKIVQINDDQSTLAKAVDSTGKDLLVEPPKKDGRFSFSRGPFGSFPRISEDGTQMVVELITPQTPAPGATHIRYEGKLSVMLAAGIKTVSAKNVPLTPGKIQLGKHEVQVKGFGPSHDWQKGKFSLTLKMPVAFADTVASWKITSPDGSELSDGPTSTMTMTATAEMDFVMDTKPQTVNIEVELYDGLQTEIVTLSFEVGLGVE